MNEEYIENVKNEVAEKLISPSFNDDDKDKRVTLFEQYKLLVDSAHKGEERRGNSNNIFLGVNSLIASFLIHPATAIVNMQTKDFSISILFNLIGMFVSWEWLKVNISYEKLNFINYVMINKLEKILPSSVFSLRAEIETGPNEEKCENKGNVILKKENLLPLAFFLLYFIYFSTIIFSFFQK